jgi:tRNA G10  N-methylase Trm11
VQEVLVSSRGLLGVGQRICIALPISVNGEGKTEQLSAEISSFVKKLGYRTIESHKVFVHRTLTREVLVYEKE